MAKEVEAVEPQGESIPADKVLQMLRIVVEEARKPVRDPIKEQQQKRMKEHNKQGLEDNRRMRIAKFESCSHMQRPGSILTGCSAIAWATQSDGKVRGHCQHCGTMFSPIKDECVSPKIWEAYQYLIRIPTHPAGDLSYTFQHA